MYSKESVVCAKHKRLADVAIHNYRDIQTFAHYCGHPGEKHW